jgi:GDP-L-fucose synthase
MIKKNDKIFLTGHKGLVGSAILRKLKKKNFTKIIVKDRKKLDLLDQKKVDQFIKKNKPKAIIIAAAKVGGIHANNIYKGEFIYENLQIQNNLIHSAYKNGIKNLIFLGSSCVYPKNSKQPIKEKYLLNSPLEKTNEPYAIAKIAGIKLCESYNFQYKTNFICLMPCNTFGPNDNYDYETSHFLPALIRKIYEAKKYNKKNFILWGTGRPLREVIFVDDVADACVFFLQKKVKDHLINIGTDTEMSIKSYAIKIKKILKYEGKIVFDKSKPDGTFRKKQDLSLSKKYGWKAKLSLNEGLKIAISDFKKRFD